LAQRRNRQIQPAQGVEKAFGQALRQTRQGRGISQEQLGLSSDFDRTYISLVERGIRSPTIRALVKMAEALEVRPSTIVRKMEDLLTSGPETND
jgi:transcriptional regulator with XRE-family HTH domain